MVFQLPENVGVTIKFPTFAFFTSRIDYLDHIIRPGQRKVSNQTPDAIR